ncbi:MAG: prepilin-type N-terminal cleavage/methylation domain-containing protein [Planctomycetota bacterium]|nr:prepilin-type N-terminal cleavage/methylation domain-containing protein [Planctomycetota bacterium]
MIRRSASAARRFRGFTLLEAVIAVVILAGVAATCVQLRVQNLRIAAAVEDAGDDRRAIEDLLLLAESGQLPGQIGPAEDDPKMTIRWRGEWLGHEFTCERTRIALPNPTANASERGLARTIVLDQYTLQYGEETIRCVRPIARVRKAAAE